MKRGFGLAVLLLATSAVVTAQIHGVPPSVTSFGPGRGPTPGVRASVTSLGPRGWSTGFFDNDRFPRGGFGHHGFGKRSGEHHHFLPGVVVPYYLPYYPYDLGYSSAYQQSTEPVVAADPDPPPDERYGDHSFYEDRMAAAPRPVQPQSPPQEQDPTVLVFTDGHKEEVRNYAIVGQMLWDFTVKGTHKIPLSQIDIDATRKLNDERGVDFVLPKS